MSDPRRSIPALDALLASPAFQQLLDRYPRERVVTAARAAVDEARTALTEGGRPDDVAGTEMLAGATAGRLAAEDVPSLRRVINASGVVLHTNLGRAPLPRAAIEAMVQAGSGYTNLEYDTPAGRRGSRYVHCSDLIRELTGAEAALVVNNAAAGLLLALNTVAAGKAVAVSRGELVEIGGGFRIPEILERSGARLLEVGSTNRTRIGDYEMPVRAGDVAAVLKVHRSNFRMRGFTEEASLAELAELTRSAGIPLLHDLGSGLLMDPASLGLPVEPRAGESLAAGADLVVVSGDKLLGGPQAGVVAGGADLVTAMKSNPLCRALRVDKTTLAGLEATLRLYRDPPTALAEIPTLRMVAERAEAMHRRAEEIAKRIGDAGVSGVAVVESRCAVGGGTYPEVEIPSWAVALSAGSGVTAPTLAARLRRGSPPVVARIEGDRLLLEVRTVLPGDVEDLVRCAAEAVAASGGTE
jgi:L-seryl-tRNA(Ser) seleniumtransferase